MSSNSAIEWTDATWNPVTGCTKVSPGCAHCYAETFAERFRGVKGHYYEHGFDVQLRSDKLDLPLRWKKPRRIFVNSMSDLFHEDVPDEFIDRVFAVMALARQHTFQVLTKRPERMREYMTSVRPDGSDTGVTGAAGAQFRIERAVHDQSDCQGCEDVSAMAWPLPNVQLGTSVENQHWADIRIPLLLQTPAAVRFLSCEPLLGRLMVDYFMGLLPEDEDGAPYPFGGINWVIVGGESHGPEDRRLVEPCCRKGSPFAPPQRKHGEYRPTETVCEAFNTGDCDVSDWRPKPAALGWVRSLRDQCQAAGVAFFFKQWGGPRPKSTGRLLDGREWSEFPK